MNMKDIEKDIMKSEMMEKAKIENPLKRVFEDEDKCEKLIQKVVKIGKSEGSDVDTDAVQDIIESFWDILSEECEYVPGYFEEYSEKMKELFYSTKGLSSQKLAEYVYNKYIGC